MPTVPPRLEALLQRDLGAVEVALVGPDEAHAERDVALRADLGRGWSLEVVLDAPPEDREALARRLDLVVGSFREILLGALSRGAAASPAERLHAELGALATSAGALDAAVIDAQSAVVWGSASAEDATPQDTSRGQVIPLAPRGERRSAPPTPPGSPIERAIAAVRALPAVRALARGSAPVVHHERDGDPPLVARSFASIYLLVLVFDAPFDELRAERAAVARLALVERLILSLPPIDPEPLGARARRPH